MFESRISYFGIICDLLPVIWNFLHSFHPSPILISFGPFGVHWYGLLLVLGGMSAYLISRRTFEWAGVGVRVLNELVTPLIIWGFVGSRLYHVLNELPYYFTRPLEIVAVWKGGLAIHGAIVGGLAALWWYAVTKERKHERTHERKNVRLFVLQLFLHFADLLAPGFALAQGIGRWGNYFNQELYGRQTSLPWGIPIDPEARVAGYEQFEYFHPTFLYESIWLFISFIILLCLLRYWLRKSPFTPPSQEGDSRRLPLTRGKHEVVSPGRLLFLYLILAGVGRFFIEFLRIDPMPMVSGVRLQQVVSGLMVVIGLIGLQWISRLLMEEKFVLR